MVKQFVIVSGEHLTFISGDLHEIGPTPALSLTPCFSYAKPGC